MKTNNQQKKINNFTIESQMHELEKNDDLITVKRKYENGIEMIQLTLEPHRLDELGYQCRLSLDEFSETAQSVVESEKDTWHELRMKDQINLLRDSILEKTILKYAKEELNIDVDAYNGTNIDYVKRFNKKGRFIGETIMVTLTKI